MNRIDKLSSASPGLTPSGHSLDVIPPGKTHSVRRVVAGLEFHARFHANPCVRAESARMLREMDRLFGYRRERLLRLSVWVALAAVGMALLVRILAAIL